MTTPTLTSVTTAELTKIRSLRSIGICLGVTFGVILGLSMLAGWSVRRAIESDNPSLLPGFDPASSGFNGVGYAQLGFVIFGVLLVTSEYVSGMIRISLAAVPRRDLFYTAKLLAGALTALVVAVPTVVLGWFTTQFGLGPHSASWDSPDVLRAMGGGVLHLVLLCLISAGIATMLRSQVLSLCLLLPFFSVGSFALSQIPVLKDIARYLPDLAGARMMAVHADLDAGLSPSIGLVVMMLWTVAVLAGGLLILQRRDA